MKRQNGTVTNHILDTGQLLTNAHVQTIWANAVKNYPAIQSATKRVELPDGDFVDLEFSAPGTRGTILLLHGLEGGASSCYIKSIFAHLSNRDFQVILLQFRGCSGSPNRLIRTYHSGHTEDLDYVAQLIFSEFGKLTGAVGYSVGGNVLLKWLGEADRRALLERAVAVSVPFDLAKSATRLDQGFSKIYRNKLLTSLQNKYIQKAQIFELPCHQQEIRKLDSFWSFDEKLTAPIHGFSDAEDYYRQSSCRFYLNRISLPTLVIQAKDDPFLPLSAIPHIDELSSYVHLMLTDKGGHVGFLERSGEQSFLKLTIERFVGG
jgi:uncharacterized protein